MLASVYLGAIVVLVGVMPWNRAGVTESPFVTVFRHAHVPAAPHIMTFVILTAALSGANAALYAASRVLFSLARTGWAPAALGRLNASGSPKPALLASSYGIVVALVLEKWAPKNAFVSILGAALVGMLLSWLVSLAAHVRFRQTDFRQPDLPALPMRSPLGAWGSALGFVLIIVALLETGWNSRLTLISGAVYMVVLTAPYFLLIEELPLEKYNIRMADELLRYRSQFPILERTTYLISNSLGAMPQGVYDAMKGYADIWATRGIRAWEERWWMLAAQVGDEIGALMNAPQARFRPIRMSLPARLWSRPALISPASATKSCIAT